MLARLTARKAYRPITFCAARLLDAERRAAADSSRNGSSEWSPRAGQSIASLPPKERGRKSFRLVMLALLPVARITNNPCRSAYRSAD